MDRELSDELLSVADQLRHVRRQLSKLVADGRWPAGMFASISSFLVYSPLVVEALERIGCRGE